MFQCNQNFTSNFIHKSRTEANRRMATLQIKSGGLRAEIVISDLYSQEMLWMFSRWALRPTKQLCNFILALLWY